MLPYTHEKVLIIIPFRKTLLPVLTKLLLWMFVLLQKGQYLLKSFLSYITDIEIK